MPFALHPRLAADTHPVATLDLSELRLMDDSRWPWLMLVPMREGVEEVHQLDAADRAALVEETARISQMFQRLTGCRSINVAALGNVVSQLHVHVVARDEGDPNWPGPIWGFGTATPYGEAERAAPIARFAAALDG